jgi:hypothetical protein
VKLADDGSVARRRPKNRAAFPHTAFSPISSVRMRTACSTESTKTFPSPFFHVDVNSPANRPFQSKAQRGTRSHSNIALRMQASFFGFVIRGRSIENRMVDVTI